MLVFAAMFIGFIWRGRQGKSLYIRPIDALDAMDDAVGRAAEMGRPVLYAPEYPLAPVALRWRGQLGENAKRVASSHLLPEMNHNEIVGWEVQKEFYPATRVIMLGDPEEGERISKRIDITARLLEAAGASVRRVSTGGENLLARMMSLIILGDYTSVYLGAAWGVDPTPVEKIDHLKSNLAETD